MLQDDRVLVFPTHRYTARTARDACFIDLLGGRLNLGRIYEEASEGVLPYDSKVLPDVRDFYIRFPKRYENGVSVANLHGNATAALVQLTQEYHKSGFICGFIQAKDRMYAKELIALDLDQAIEAHVLDGRYGVRRVSARNLTAAEKLVDKVHLSPSLLLSAEELNEAIDVLDELTGVGYRQGFEAGLDFYAEFVNIVGHLSQGVLEALFERGV